MSGFFLFCFVLFFYDFLFLMWTIFKVFTESVKVLFLFYVLVFGPQGTWDLCCPDRDRTHSLKEIYFFVPLKLRNIPGVMKEWMMFGV